MKVLRVLAVPLVLVVASCGGGDEIGNDADAEAFCERLRTLEAGDAIDADEDVEAAMAEMQALRDTAPAQIRDDLDTVLDVFRQMEELEPATDDEDAFGAVFALLLDPDFTAASDRLEQFGVDECGLEPSSGEDLESGFDVDLDAPETDTDTDTGNDLDIGETDAVNPDAVNPDDLITEAADVPDPLFDPFFDDDVVDPSSISINGLKYHLDVNYTEAPWRTRLMSYSVGGGVVIVGGLELDDVAVQVCDAVAGYVVPFEPDWEITIEAYAEDDGGTYDYVGDLITGTASNGC